MSWKTMRSLVPNGDLRDLAGRSKAFLDTFWFSAGTGQTWLSKIWPSNVHYSTFGQTLTIFIGRRLIICRASFLVSGSVLVYIAGSVLPTTISLRKREYILPIAWSVGCLLGAITPCVDCGHCKTLRNFTLDWSSHLWAVKFSAGHANTFTKDYDSRCSIK